jgi:hypothetical protein
MLGTFTKGMKVKIPANFKSNGKPIPVENVTVRIEHYDDIERRVMHDLPETLMKQVSSSDYLYEYEVPQSMKVGSYVVRMAAKIPQNGNKLFEAWEQFDVATSSLSIQPDDRVANAEEIQREPVKINGSIDFYQHDNFVSPSQEKVVEDVVVDVENKPIKGVHVNVYPKREFSPKDPNNVKVASTMTDEDGKWRLALVPGEYAFSYKGIGYKEYREFRKV